MLARIARDWHPHLKMIIDAADYELSACIPVISSKPDIELPVRAVGPRADGVVDIAATTPTTPPTPTTTTSMVTILGDAAHAMSPMGQAGGDLAIRDAVDLAALVVERGLNAATVRAFEEIMAARAKRHLERAFATGRQFWTHDAYREVHL
ncbi:hypothetical protein BD289DRAFT_448283 [Coniella lustricola]|uniref:FAD-binding domain-containing protein n=1 Tax=Coniella lustricola TaxID=2025994 RepID=A0A2T2ZSB6_9PEZI|nr:hypothetical protein BD289DRAFT_448283 [Coniella lustricola]